MSKADDTVWVSAAMMDSSLVKAFTSDVFENDVDKAVEATKGNAKGVPFPADRFPKEIYYNYRDKKAKHQPDIFNASSFWVVSAACADVLRQFDLGEGALYPTKLFQFDRTTLVKGEYFCLNFGNQKQAFVPEYSPMAQRPHPTQDMWKLSFVPKDGEMAVTKVALERPDLWIDPWVRHAIFLSDPLVQALKAAKLTRRYGLRKCKVIRLN